MPIFHYEAMSPTGDRISGEIEAEGRDFVLAQLNRLGHLPIEVRTQATTRRSPAASAGRVFAAGPNAAGVSVFTRELAMLLRAGSTLERALSLLEAEGAARMRPVVANLGKKLKDGSSLAEALAAAGSMFEPGYVNMVRIAEATGTLDTVLERIADTREQDQKLRSRIVSASIYPAFLIVTALAAVLLMLVVVVPRFKAMIESAGGTAPASAQSMVAVSDWLVANWYWLAFGLTGLVLAVIVAARQRPVRAALQQAALSLPLFGRLARTAMTVRFCRSLGTLIENGIALPEALRLTRDAVGSVRAADAVEEAYQAVRKGQPFTEPLARSGLFFPVVVSMLRVGEESGEISQTCMHLGRMYEQKLELGLTRLFTILEPAIIILVSLFVAGVMLTIIQSVISINDLVL